MAVIIWTTHCAGKIMKMTLSRYLSNSAICDVTQMVYKIINKQLAASVQNIMIRGRRHYSILKF